MYGMGHIRNALPEVMGRHRVKQAALAEAAGLRYATVNALYNGKTERLDFSTLAAVLDGLHSLTGEHYTAADLLEYTPPTPEEEDTHLLSSSTSDLRAELDTLESDTPPHELDAWSAAFESKSA